MPLCPDCLNAVLSNILTSNVLKNTITVAINFFGLTRASVFYFLLEYFNIVMSLEDQAIAGENTDAAQQSLKALFGDDIDPNVVMKLLKGLSPDKINNTLMPVKNGNAQIFPQSYRTFQKLTNGQLNKFKSYWESMTEPSRAAIFICES